MLLAAQEVYGFGHKRAWRLLKRVDEIVCTALDSEEVILRRLANARAEMQEAPHYDALIVNDDLDTAYDHLRAAYLAATLAPHCRPGLVEALNNGHLL